MRLNKLCKRLWANISTMAMATAMIATFPLTAYASEGDVTISVDFGEPVTLRAQSEYSALDLSKLINIKTEANGKNKALPIYAVEAEKFNSLGDKSENVVKNYSGIVTGDLEGEYKTVETCFVTYNDDVMAYEYVTLLVTGEAKDVVNNYKTGQWYQSYENGVEWRYTINDAGLIDKLYTENTELSSYIIDDTLFVPSMINGIPVVGIGSGTRTPFVPEGIYFNNVEFPVTLLVIGDYSFYGNKNNFEVTLPTTTISVGNKAFYSSKITALTVSGNTDIDEQAFANCRNLESVMILGRSIIGKRAFDGGKAGSSLKELVFAGSPTICQMAFCNNDKLTQLSFHKGASVEFDSFLGCENIKNVTVEKDANMVSQEMFKNAKISVR
nr:leucine-rich repeat domain-containing protein [uncultured Butyrivibrio sp.]